ncbi:Hypp7829 [Branchiostoma lanceolatum]|uniref:Hypp7829 protein n=1 Tax=Branchiostoma lanceolatum TaxID=7740 RepID=A0A8J9Z517_BRALA|nr:Hypp7829 [Branchiostoma lanceolatum]
METVSSRIYSFSLIGQVVKHFTGVRVSTDNQISLLQEDPSVLAQAGRILLADAPKLLPSTQPQVTDVWNYRQIVVKNLKPAIHTHATSSGCSRIVSV